MTIYGYARVSTDDQTLDVQKVALAAADCSKVFAEKISGARSDRPQLGRLLKTIQPGDVVIVTKLDRLARSTRDLLNITHELAEKGTGFKVLDNPALDTTNHHGKLLLDVLAAIGEFERKLIQARTGEGRKRAMANGVRMGRKPKLTPFQVKEALKMRDAGVLGTVIAETFGVSPATICRL
jgi:DNA invertase Pin-like site-specific DNA recombinase